MDDNRTADYRQYLKQKQDNLRQFLDDVRSMGGYVFFRQRDPALTEELMKVFRVTLDDNKGA